MNKMIKRNLLIVVLIVLLTAGFVYIYNPIPADTGWPSGLSSIYPETGLFRIDPRTILASLEQGDMSAFIPDPKPIDERYDGSVVHQEPVPWRQSDHFKLASTVNELVWKDDQNNWRLFLIVLNSECQNDLDGLSSSTVQYFKPSYNRGRIIYTWRKIEIDPEYAHIAWGGGVERAHPLFGLKSIDLSKLKISAEEAIQIAEEHGGRDARLAVQNQCNIHLTLMPQRHHGWRVNYQSADFEIEIDPYTGEVIK